MGPFSFTGQPNAMGGREVGGLANQLAAHMELDNPRHRDSVQRFWRAPRIAQRPGLKAVELFDAVRARKVRAVWVMATNPVVSLPAADAVRAALAQCDFVVVSDCVRHTDTSALAHVLLPALAWGEKEGTVTNSERRISRQRRFLPAPGEARPDWWIINRVAQAMGYEQGFDHTSAAQIFREHAQLSIFDNDGTRDFDLGGLADLSDAAYDDLAPVQWPVKKSADGKRLFADGRFFTASGKARFIAVTPADVAHAPDESFPFSLNTGRIRDQWHTMTRTGKTARLMEHDPEPYVELHPADAAAKGLEDGALVRVFSRWGEAIVRARVSAEQQPGSVFVPMHWNEQFARLARINAAVNPALDPISGQPEFKHTPVNLARYQPLWHGFLLSRRQLALTEASYWVMATGTQHYRYELAGEQAPGDWPAWARGLLCQSDTDINWVEYLDVGGRSYRGVRLVGGRIESCVYIGPSHKLPPRSWLAGLFAKEQVSAEERAALLAGRAPAGQQDSGRIVCACYHVGLNTIVEAIAREKLPSVEAIGACLKAGTNCRSCVPELTAILAQSAAKPAS
jgi:assimilatory nitrate reductase catalytic subunit